MNFRFLLKKKVIIPTIIILLVGGGIYRARTKGSNPDDIQTEKVTKQDLRQTVLATGQVISETDLTLSFNKGGTVTRVNTKVGSRVKGGELLATLDQKNELAVLTSAQGTLAQAKANLQKVLDGSSSEQVASAESKVKAAEVRLSNAQNNLAQVKSQQQVLVNNAYRTLLNTDLEAIPATSNVNTSNPAISGTYTGSGEGVYTIRQWGNQFDILGLETGGLKFISTITPVALGAKGLYILFPSGYTDLGDTWTVSIPNKNSASYT